MGREKVLLIEDDEDIAGFIELELAHEGYDITVVNDGREGLRQTLAQNWDILLLDVMLPGINGLEVCRRIRMETQVPIIMLTAKGEVSDRVAGIDYGADDYIVKPFAIEELMARMRGLLRRVSFTNGTQTVLTVADVVLNLETREVSRAGNAVHLTPREFDLFRCFLDNKNHVLSRETLLQTVWGYDFAGDTNVVDVYVRYIRSKIDDGYPVALIHTIRGVGYVLKEQ